VVAAWQVDSASADSSDAEKPVVLTPDIGGSLPRSQSLILAQPDAVYLPGVDDVRPFWTG
jgi:hypothetical protein